MLGSDIIKPRYVFGQEHLHTGHLSGGGRIEFQNASARMRRADRPDLEHAFARSLIVGVEGAASDMLVAAFMRQCARDRLCSNGRCQTGEALMPLFPMSFPTSRLEIEFLKQAAD